MGKYEPLRQFLARQDRTEVRLTFGEIEQIVGTSLPPSKLHRAWWSNNPNNSVMTKEWLAAGYRPEQVDLEGQRLVFRRVLESYFRPDRDKAEMEAGGPQPYSSLVGCMKGWITVAPGVDLTEPADPEWGNIAWGDFDPSQVHGQ